MSLSKEQALTLKLDHEKEKNYKKMVAMGKCALRYGTRFAAQTFKEKDHIAYYWKRKVSEPDFHPKTLGGGEPKYPAIEVQTIVWEFVQTRRQICLREVQVHLETNNISYSRMTLSRMFTTWRWSFKIPTVMQQQKYTLENMRYYVDFCNWFGTRSLDQLRKLKFIDEVHFRTKDFRNRKYALAPIGERVVVTASQQLDHNSWNATVIIRVDNPDEPIALNIRQDSNTAYDFTLFVMTMVERGFLSEGDTLIYDNAAVHLSADVFVDLMDYLERHGITPLPLPTYSPELNPIERCFNIVKNFLRYERDPEVPLLCDILRGFAKITQEIIAKEYLCSANYFVDKPLLIPPPLRNIIT